MKSYDKKYHTLLHSYLYSDKKYYGVRAKLALIKYFKGISKDAKILDFGCGLGQNIFLLSNAIGYDISKFSLNFCTEKGLKVVSNLSKVRNSSLDVVFSCHVLEHVKSPFDILKKMHSKLKKGGKLILVLPTGKTNMAKNFEKLELSQHLYRWNFIEINNLLIKVGFRVIENKYLWGAAYRTLLPLQAINFKLYALATQLVSFLFLRGAKEMKVVAVKGY